MRRGFNQIFFRIHFNAKEYLTHRFLVSLKDFNYKIYLLRGVISKRGRGFISLIKRFEKVFYKKISPYASIFRYLIKGTSLFLLFRLTYFKRGLHI